MSSLVEEFHEAIGAMENLENALTPIEKLILRKRLFHPKPTTFISIGKQVGQSGESIRRTQKRLEQKIADVIKPIESIVELLKRELAPIIDYSELDKRISRILACLPYKETLDFVKRIIVHHLDYSNYSNLYVNSQARDLIKDLRESASLIADDAGLIDEYTLKNRLPDTSWEQFWPMLLRCCNFKRIGEHLALRKSAKAQVKAALLTIGKSATKEEISSHCEVPLEKIGGHLSVIPSILRADRQRWGLAEWIDDEYEGIAAKIIQRIDEDGGATKLSRLLDELPRLFGVSETSVRAYVGASQFHIRDGHVSLANASSISLRHLTDVIEGYDEDGFPYWSFVVKNRYFSGYSLMGFPPELANALGCEPNQSIRIKVNKPLGCRNVSISWRMASHTGPSLGYLSDPLRKLEALEPERVLLILKLPDSVELRLAKPPSECPTPGDRNSKTSEPTLP